MVTAATVFTNGGGAASVPLPIPNDPNLLGANLFFQYAVFKPAGALFNVADLSNGLQIQIGN